MRIKITSPPKMLIQLLATAIFGLGLSACSSTPMTQQTGAQPTPPTTLISPKRETPVVPERPARMHIWAEFDEKSCRVITPVISVLKQPTKGTVTFRQNQKTKIRYSNAGTCIGKNLSGTGIYYTADKGQTGTDHFSVTATTKSGKTLTRSFDLQIAE